MRLLYNETMKEIWVLDIGSGKLIFLSGKKSLSGLCSVARLETVDYDGFYGGEWLSPEKLRDDVASVIPVGVKRPSTLYVGVPGDFLNFRNNTVHTRFDCVKTVTRGDVDRLSAEGNIYSSDKRRTVIASATCGFRLDGGEFVVDPVGRQTASLSSDVTYILCESDFCDAIAAAVAPYGFKDVCFVSSFWAECTTMIDGYARTKGAVVVDVGYMSSSAAYVIGDGFDGEVTMETGYATIAGALIEKFSLDGDEAERLLAEVNLGYGDDETYMLDARDGVLSFSAGAVHDAVRGELDKLASVIASLRGDGDAELYVTGGGLSAVKGALAYIGGAVDCTPQTFAPSVPMYTKPWLSSAFGTFDAACKTERGNSLFGRLLDKIRR